MEIENFSLKKLRNYNLTKNYPHIIIFLFTLSPFNRPFIDIGDDDDPWHVNLC